MVFKRKKKQTTLKNLKSLFFPEGGWRRAIEYLSHRIKRLQDSPHRIALGLSFGVFASFSPLFGFHFVEGKFQCDGLAMGKFQLKIFEVDLWNQVLCPLVDTMGLCCHCP